MLVGIVSESFARAAWPGREALGQRYRRGGPPESDPWITVVGVAADARHRGRNLDDYDPMDHYLPVFQKTTNRIGVFVRTEREAASVAAELRRAVGEIDGDVPLFDVATMAERMAKEEGEGRFYAALLGAFAASALLLAVLGIYGVIAYTVDQHSRELGWRLALGAQRGEVLRRIVGETGLLIGAGLALGLPAAWGMARGIASLLVGVTPADAGTFVLVPVVLAITGLVAAAIPARGVLRVDPVEAMRSD
jgi:hypothetical protein